MIRDKKLLLLSIFLLGVVLAILYFGFFRDTLSKPPLTAKITVDRTVIKSNKGKVVVRPIEKKDKATVTITYTNNTSKPISRVRLNIVDVESSNPHTFSLFQGKNTLAVYNQTDIKSGAYLLKDIPAHSTMKAQLYLLAKDRGFTRFRMYIVTDNLRVETGTLYVKAEF